MTPKQELLQELETTPLPIILQLLQFLRFLKAQKPPLDFIDFAGTTADMDNAIEDPIVTSQNDRPQDSSRHLLEIITADAYSSGKISTAEVRQILQLPSRLSVHDFLKRMGVYLNYDESELDKDLQTLKEFRVQ
jgi:predicted HTH domain antitoxin